MFRKDDEDFLIEQIPTFLITLDNISNLEYFDEILDVRSNEEFTKDHILNSLNVPVITKSEQDVVHTLGRQDKEAARKTELVYIRSHLEKHIEDHFKGAGAMKKPPHTLIHTYRPLVLSQSGGERSQLVGLCLVQLGFYPHLAEGGYLQYRALVLKMVERDVDKFRMIVITGPKHGGKGHLVRTVRENEEQLVDLEQLSTEHSPSQEFFDTLLFNSLLQFTVTRVVWVVYQSGELGGVRLSTKMKEVMSKSARVHMETSLEERIKFIIQDFTCISRDQNSTETAMQDVVNAAEKNEDDTWEDVVNRFDDGVDWVRDLMDVHKILSTVANDGEENLEGHIFFIGRPREGYNDDDSPRFMEE